MPNTEKTIPDAARAALLEAQTNSPFIFEGDGTTPLTSTNYHYNDWWFAYLGSLGFTGSISDRELAYWLDLFQQTVGQSFSEAFGQGFT